MHKNTIIVEISVPVNEVFTFTTDPKNTPKWLDFVIKEERSTSTVCVGTRYKNISLDAQQQQRETIYEVTAFEIDCLFELEDVAGSYKCTYRYEPIEHGKATRLTYTETNGPNQPLVNPLTQEPFNILKTILEAT